MSASDNKHERYDIESADILFEDVWADEDEDTCPKCGAKLTGAVDRCASCGTRVDVCTGSCSSCGARVCVGDGKGNPR